jgi:hypothetical protein
MLKHQQQHIVLEGIDTVLKKALLRCATPPSMYAIVVNGYYQMVVLQHDDLQSLRFQVAIDSARQYFPSIKWAVTTDIYFWIRNFFTKADLIQVGKYIQYTQTYAYTSRLLNQ